MVYKKLCNLILVLLIVGCSNTKPGGKQGGTTPPQASIPEYPKLPSEYPDSDRQAQIQPAPGDYYAASLSGDFASSSAAHNFIRTMVQKHGFSETYLNGLLSQAQSLESVVKLEQPAPRTTYASAPVSAGSWSRYRQKFIDEMHISKGAAFWQDHQDALQKASSKYRVNPEYIVAIIGVETHFGSYVGKTRTLDALATLAFHTERRATYFSAELENFLLMTREESYEPLTVFGSWAGAMGLAQFMPSNVRTLAVDLNGDGKRNLWQPEDAIGSVANYFAQKGWQFNQAVANRTSQSFGVSLVTLSTYSGDEYWEVYPNFNVIKKYNPSTHYAMAVHQLAQAIKQRING